MKKIIILILTCLLVVSISIWGCKRKDKPTSSRNSKISSVEMVSASSSSGQETHSSQGGVTSQPGYSNVEASTSNSQTIVNSSSSVENSSSNQTSSSVVNSSSSQTIVNSSSSVENSSSNQTSSSVVNSSSSQTIVNSSSSVENSSNNQTSSSVVNSSSSQTIVNSSSSASSSSSQTSSSAVSSSSSATSSSQNSSSSSTEEQTYGYSYSVVNYPNSLVKVEILVNGDTVERVKAGQEYILKVTTLDLLDHPLAIITVNGVEVLNVENTNSNYYEYTATFVSSTLVCTEEIVIEVKVATMSPSI